MVSKPFVVEEDAGDDERSGEATAACLIYSRYEPQAELAVELEEAPSSIPWA